MDDYQYAFVYALADPRDCSVFYAGVSVNPVQRYYSHKGAYTKDPRSRRIAELKREGLLPRMIILEVVPRGDSFTAEKQWIGRLRGKDYPLVNCTSGGQGPSDSAVSLETRKKMRNAKLGRKLPPEHRLNIARALKGQVISAEARRKMSLAARAPERIAAAAAQGRKNATMRDPQFRDRIEPKRRQGNAAYLHKRWHADRNRFNPKCALCRTGQP